MSSGNVYFCPAHPKGHHDDVNGICALCGWDVPKDYVPKTNDPNRCRTCNRKTVKMSGHWWCSWCRRLWDDGPDEAPHNNPVVAAIKIEEEDLKNRTRRRRSPLSGGKSGKRK